MSRVKSVAEVKRAMGALGPMLPGSISKQWNVCGKPGCQCKDPSKPKKHGPYYQLSFTVAGKSSSLFLKPGEVAEARRCLRRYQRFKALCSELLAAYVREARQRGLAAMSEVE
jgi:hypothetical protein